MCGIVGYLGLKQAAPMLVSGLKRLEYRGYDSFGIATIGSSLLTAKKCGRISESNGFAASFEGRMGIGHTRWATHGVPNDQNSHPHCDCTGTIAIVHNGIIENYAVLRRQLEERGHRFTSETDTEVIVHIIEEYYAGDLLEAVKKTLPHLEGSYAVLAIAEKDPRIIAARNASPLVLGIGDGEWFAASDMTPLLDYTQQVVFLEDGDIAALSPDGICVFHDGAEVSRPAERIEWDLESAKKGGFAHFMLKEIFEQPKVFYDSVSADIDPGVIRAIRDAGGLMVVACGTSYHAGLIFRYLVEQLCNIPVRVELASEFKYFTPPMQDLVIAVTQSGETADTIAALKKAKAHNCGTLAITNVLGSSVTRVAENTIYTRAGPEISVAATKSFTAQIAVFFTLINHLCDRQYDEILHTAHQAIETVLLEDISAAAEYCKRAQDIFFIGRGAMYPAALEGALKMKEITYIHAEGYAAGELKHGPFSLLSPKTPVIALCTPGDSYAVMLSNIKEVTARGAPVIAIGREGDRELAEIADVMIPLPPTHHLTELVTTSVVLQLLAYHTANALGRDIDKPRNLAKSVTVE
ncbi:MAG: glutamine amidotransferase [Methanoculleus sp. SDB]|nr:MAG: glutamine amidotransferase [Methanoculleus sp. SDB]